MIGENHQQKKCMLFKKISKTDKYLTRLTRNKRETQWRMRYYFWFYRNRIMRGIDVKTSNKLVEIGKFLKTHSARLDKEDRKH